MLPERCQMFLERYPQCSLNVAKYSLKTGVFICGVISLLKWCVTYS
jgi:hypothetical protein